MVTTLPKSFSKHAPVQVALQVYAQELARLDKGSDTISKQQILRLLLVRDAVEAKLQANNSISLQAKVLAVLSELDNKLQDLAPALTKENMLADCRRSRQPSETAWWWWLEDAVPETKIHALDRLDWLWNFLSAGSLVTSASFLTITAQAFSVVGGFDLIQTLSTLSQATGLVLIAGGALTNRGQTFVKSILKKLNIPTHFHSEVTLGASLLLLLGSYGMYNSLPKFSNFYYEKGRRAQEAGNLYVAIDYFKEAIAFNPDATAPHNHLAEVYQNLERFQEAQAEYQDGLLKGDIVALNGMGTLSLAAANNEESGEFGELSGLLDAEVLFRIGLNQLEGMEGLNENEQFLQASLHRNLGITLMKRGNAADTSDAEQQVLLKTARQHFQESVKIEETMTSEKTRPGQGVAHCYIAALNENNGVTQATAMNWQVCQQKAHPASLEQYEDILRLGTGSIGLQLNTKHILESDLN